jgi:uncharacterized membrane protein YidH (DUF202 family)
MRQRAATWLAISIGVVVVFLAFIFAVLQQGY